MKRKKLWGLDEHIHLVTHKKGRLVTACYCGWVGGVHTSHDRAVRHWERHVQTVQQDAATMRQARP